MTLLAELHAALSSLTVPVWNWPAPVEVRKGEAYVTVRRQPSTVANELDGTVGLSRIPVSVVAWAHDQARAESLGSEIAQLLAAYANTVVRKVFIRSRSSEFDRFAKTHGLRVVAEVVMEET